MKSNKIWCKKATNNCTFNLNVHTHETVRMQGMIKTNKIQQKISHAPFSTYRVCS